MTAVPPSVTRSPTTRTSRRPPRADACSAVSTVRPSRAAHHGPSWQWAEPVTGSSSMPHVGGEHPGDDVGPARLAGGGDDDTVGVHCGERGDVGSQFAHRDRVGDLGEQERADGDDAHLRAERFDQPRVERDGARRDRREVQLDAPAAARGSAARRCGCGTSTVPLATEDVGGGQRGVAAQVDLDRRA